MQEPMTPPPMPDDAASRLAALSSALVPIFRGRFCTLLLPNRPVATFAHDQILYEQGEDKRTFFFVRTGVVKTGTVASDGREIVYDLRKDGDVVGELCALHAVRRDRAVALAPTLAVVVPFHDVVETLAKHATLLGDFIGIFCSALSEAYDHIDSLAFDSVALRTTSVLQSLAKKVGRRVGQLTELPIYLTQEELAQMVAARRERVSTTLNDLRRQGIVHYSTRGHLRLDVRALERYRPDHIPGTSALA